MGAWASLGGRVGKVTMNPDSDSEVKLQWAVRRHPLVTHTGSFSSSGSLVAIFPPHGLSIETDYLSTVVKLLLQQQMCILESILRLQLRVLACRAYA
jgi:hypothetical protein